MSATDVMLAELQGEAQQQNDFIDALVEGARKEDRDLNANERELLQAAPHRVGGHQRAAHRHA